VITILLVGSHGARVPLPNFEKSLIVETANSKPAKKTAMPKKNVHSTILSGCQPEQYSNIKGMTTVTWKGSAMTALKALKLSEWIFIALFFSQYFFKSFHIHL
jgi:hypothetical protein